MSESQCGGLQSQSLPSSYPHATEARIFITLSNAGNGWSLRTQLRCFQVQKWCSQPSLARPSRTKHCAAHDGVLTKPFVCTPVCTSGLLFCRWSELELERGPLWQLSIQVVQLEPVTLTPTDTSTTTQRRRTTARFLVHRSCWKPRAPLDPASAT
jgi:hypothetical protein